MRELSTTTCFAGRPSYLVAKRFNTGLRYLSIPAGVAFACLVPDGPLLVSAMPW